MTRSGFVDRSDVIVWIMNQLDTTFEGHQMVKVNFEQFLVSGPVEDMTVPPTDWHMEWGASITGHVDVKEETDEHVHPGQQPR